MDNNTSKMGLDIGSTTVKCTVIDNGKVIFSYYERHMSDITAAVATMLKAAYDELGDINVTVCVTGSGGFSVGKWLALPFVQEVIASSTAVKEYIQKTEV